MRYVGIDIASEKHFVAIVDDQSEVLTKPTGFTEDAEGYAKLFALLGPSEEVALVAMEATGHYWKNVFAALAAKGYPVALVNPLRTNRFASEDMQRTKTDALDALSIARFAAQKRPSPSRLPDSATEDLRELVRLRERLLQDFTDRVRQLHRLVDLGFPEFTRWVRTLESALATTLLSKYPTAEAFAGVRPKALANLKYDGRHFVGLELATQIIEGAKISVGRHHGHAYQIQVKYFCQDLETLRGRLRQLDQDIESQIDRHEIGKLLTTIEGIGPGSAARIIATIGNPADFRNERALSAYLGVVPALRQSGKRTPTRAGTTPYGNGELRSALYMPTMVAVQRNRWLKAFYDRLVATGKPKKLVLIAAMNKLMHAIYSVAKNRKPFVPILKEVTP